MQAFKHILVATDFGASSERALERAVKLAAKFDAKLTLLHVWEIPVYPYMDFVLSSAELLRRVEQSAEQRLAAQLSELQKRLPSARSLLKMGVPWEQILATVKEEQADVIVMGTHGRRGVEHVLMGSVAEKVVRLASVPVFTVRSTAEAPVDDFKHILAPTDFEPASAGALKLATSLAASFGAKVTLLHVWEVQLYPYMDSIMNTEVMYRIEQAAKDQLEASLAQLQLVLPSAQARLETGLPGPTILEMIPKLGVDLVVMGTHGRHGLSHTLLGSVAERVVRASEVPVFTVHHRSEKSPG